MEKYIGCMVSLDCGRTLGIYQGQIESIDTQQSSITLIRAFRNGVPYKLPQVTIRSQDINDLQIIKYSDEVKTVNTFSNVPNINVTSTLATTTTTMTATFTSATSIPAPTIAPIMTAPVVPTFPLNNIKIDLSSIFSQSKKFQCLDGMQNIFKETVTDKLNRQPVSFSNDDFKDESTYKQQIKGQKNRHKTSVTPPNNFGRHQYSYELEESFNAHSKRDDNQKQKSNKQQNYYSGFDDNSYNNSHGNASNYNQHYKSHHMINDAQQVNNYNNGGHKGSSKELVNKTQSLKISNSFTETHHNAYSNVHTYKGGHEPHHSPTRKPRNAPRRNNSECFNHCDNDFDVEFDFEKNLALFDKAAVAMELSSGNTPQNSVAGGNIKQIQQQQQQQQHSLQKEVTASNINFNYDQVPKYKCDENILRGVQSSKRQIYLIESQQQQNDRLILGEYKTDAELIVPGITEELREKLFDVSRKLGFGRWRLVESFGRGVSEAVMQYLGGSTRFEPKNAHQRPTIIFLLGPPSWQSASAVNCAQALANRSANVYVYVTSSVSSSTTSSAVGSHGDCDDSFVEEIKLFKMTSGIVISDCLDLQKLESVDLIITTFDCDTDNDDTINNNSMATTTTTKQQQQSRMYAINWATRRKAPVFTIEPSSRLKSTSIDYKRSFVCCLPPWFKGQNVGQVSLCDVGWPGKIFKEAGLVYNSPFFDKFFISLHAS